jgi:hypothetical protein
VTTAVCVRPTGTTRAAVHRVAEANPPRSTPRPHNAV